MTTAVEKEEVAMTDPVDAEPIPYAEVTAESYGRDFAASSAGTPMRRGVLLRGTCPRCRHGMSFPLITRVFQTGGAETERGTTAEGQEDKPVLCTCDGTHPGKPFREEGCGAYWNVRLTTEESS
ncbi:hypothetical protein [Lentzea sp. CA-135723]|uniref:hypothetical protein n=1 Tax=Lentzea sp. CA-135723 TaxID=3239950 RepID=UPI003D8D78C3